VSHLQNILCLIRVGSVASDYMDVFLVTNTNVSLRLSSVFFGGNFDMLVNTYNHHLMRLLLCSLDVLNVLLYMSVYETRSSGKN
jgi:hypothetical protein